MANKTEEQLSTLNEPRPCCFGPAPTWQQPNLTEFTAAKAIAAAHDRLLTHSFSPSPGPPGSRFLHGAALEAFQRASRMQHLPATFGHECSSHPLSEQVSLLIKLSPPGGSALNGSGCRPLLQKAPELL